MYKIVLCIFLFIVIVSLGICEQVFIRNSFDDLCDDCREVQQLLLAGDYEKAYEKLDTCLIHPGKRQGACT